MTGAGTADLVAMVVTGVVVVVVTGDCALAIAGPAMLSGKADTNAPTKPLVAVLEERVFIDYSFLSLEWITTV